jgi:hypothetical protein
LTSSWLELVAFSQITIPRLQEMPMSRQQTASEQA